MTYTIRIMMEKQDVSTLIESTLPSQQLKESPLGATIIESVIPARIQESQLDEYAETIANRLFDQGFDDFDIQIESDAASVDDILEETYDGNDFFEEYGVVGFVDNGLNEAEYQGREVKLNKPMQGDVKKFKVYVKDPKTGNVKKVNFGDPDMKIKKSDPDRRRSFRARHNCENPGPKTKARYWSCKKW